MGVAFLRISASWLKTQRRLVFLTLLASDEIFDFGERPNPYLIPLLWFGR